MPSINLRCITKKSLLWPALLALSLGLPARGDDLTRAVTTAADDAAENYIDQLPQLNDDLEFGWDPDRNDNEIVGLRFTNMTIPQGSTINSAYVQFYSDDVAPGTNATRTFLIQGQAGDNAATFTTATTNISSRSLTATSVGWPTSQWSAAAQGIEQRTPNIAAVVQEIVNRPNWQSGNSLALIVGTLPRATGRSWSSTAPLTAAPTG